MRYMSKSTIIHILKRYRFFFFFVIASQAIPGVPKIKEKYNPATWMLEASSISAEVRLGIDFAEYYRSSDLFK